MAEVFDFNKFRAKKQHEKIAEKLAAEPSQTEYQNYLQIMKLVIRDKAVRKEVLTLDCISEDEAVFYDEDGTEVDSAFIFGPNADDSENSDLLISGVMFYSPRRIIIRNSEVLDEYLLFTLKELFEDRIVLES